MRNMCIEAAGMIPRVKCIGWDLVLTDKGWVIVEGNWATQLVIPSKLFALSAYRLLRNKAHLAEECIRDYEPVFSGREEYCAYIDSKHTIYEDRVPNPDGGV